MLHYVQSVACGLSFRLIVNLIKWTWKLWFVKSAYSDFDVKIMLHNPISDYFNKVEAVVSETTLRWMQHADVVSFRIVYSCFNNVG